MSGTDLPATPNSAEMADCEFMDTRDCGAVSTLLPILFLHIQNRTPKRSAVASYEAAASFAACGSVEKIGEREFWRLTIDKLYSSSPFTDPFAKYRRAKAGMSSCLM